MVQPRAIPCLLLKGDGLVKTVRFANPKYVGDPINAVKLFNDRAADELLFLDITAARERREPDYARLEDIAGEAFMPIGYGGGVRSCEQARRLFRLGVEKVAVTTAAWERPELVTELAAEFGSQSIVVGIDVTRDWLNRRRLATRGGAERHTTDLVAYARAMEARGAGELLVHAIDRDGTMAGFDLELTREISGAVGIPVIACGGAGSLADLAAAVASGASAAAAGSLFVFTGPHRAVLINYPSAQQLRQAFAGSGGRG
jgi:cyclase